MTKSLNVLFRESMDRNIKQIRSLELITLNVYPNPAAEKTRVQIELNYYARLRIRLMDLNSKILAEEKFENQQYCDDTFNLGALSNGLYLIDIYATSEKGNIQKRIKIIKSE
jgi:hypothetical protein